METLKNNRGVAIVFVAVFLALLLVLLGLATDAGWTVYVRSQGQARVDAAALAAASALTSSNAGTRQTEAEARANTFSDQNSVVNPTVDPANTVEPMFYNYNTHALIGAADWTPVNCNAVRVSTSVPTPLFFSGIRNFMTGGSEANSMNINVNATAYLGCPGEEKPELPVAFCHTSIGYPNNCNVTDGLQVPSPTDNSAFFTPSGMTANNMNCRTLVNNPSLMPSIGVNEDINLNNGQLTDCLNAIKDQFNQHGSPWCVLVPVFDGDCTAGNFNQARPVLGFAEFCITEVVTTGSPKYVRGELKCPYTVQGPSGGECFGVSATNPILVQ